MIKEMVYTKERDVVILACDNYEGYNFLVVSLGTHPCCYIEIPPEHVLYNVYVGDIDLHCHGGVTFNGRLPFVPNSPYYIGWDYCHCDDYAGYREEGYGRKYSTSDLLIDVKKTIDNLKLLKKFTVISYYWGHEER